MINEAQQGCKRKIRPLAKRKKVLCLFKAGKSGINEPPREVEIKANSDKETHQKENFYQNRSPPSLGGFCVVEGRIIFFVRSEYFISYSIKRMKKNANNTKNHPL